MNMFIIFADNEKMCSRNSTLWHDWEIFNVSIPWCVKSSCQGFCGEYVSAELKPGKMQSSCSCDALCSYYDDCCIDYEWACVMNKSTVAPHSNFVNYLKIPSHPSINISNVKMHFLLKDIEKRRSRSRYEDFKTECVALTYPQAPRMPNIANAFLVKYMMMITVCPTNFSSPQLRNLCSRKIETHNIKSFVPVLAGQQVYQNVYCALCHSHKLDDIKAFEVHMHCFDKSTMFQLLRYNEKEFSDNVAKCCDFMFHPPNDMRFILVQKLRCDKYFTFIDTCSNGDSDAARVCLSYTQIAQIGPYIYKNYHCAVCNPDKAKFSMTLYGQQACWHQQYGSGVGSSSLTMLLDFQGYNPTTLIHVATHPFNYVRIGCPPNSFVENRKCIANVNVLLQDMAQTTQCKAFVKDSNLSDSNMQIIGQYNFFFVFSHFPSDADIFLIKEVLTGLQTIESIFLQVDIHKVDENFISNATCSRQNISIVGFLLANMEADIFDGMPQMDNMVFVCIGLTEIILSSLKNANAMKWLDENGILYWSDKMIMMGVLETCTRMIGACDIFTTSTIKDKAVDNHNNGNHMHHPTALVLKFKHVEGANMTSSKVSVFCKDSLLSCRKQVIPNRDVHVNVTTKGLLVYNKLKTLLTTSFLITDNGSFLVCKHILNTLTEDTSMDLLTLMSTVGITLSMVCLLFTFLIYCYFNALRHGPGVYIMSFVATLFFAQLLFIFNKQFHPIPLACQIIAGLQHFLWLSAFFWMNALALDIFNRISSNVVVISHRKTFFKFSSYAWGLPFSFVAVCFVLDFVHILDFGYGQGQSCWITNQSNLLIFFGVPVLVIILANVVLFIKTAIHIYHIGKQASQTCINQDNKTMLIIFIKISSTMGFGWLFGFLASALNISFFWYLFVICCSLQGVQVWLSFVMNKRLLNMCRIACGCVEHNSE